MIVDYVFDVILVALVSIIRWMLLIGILQFALTFFGASDFLHLIGVGFYELMYAD